MPRGQQHLRQLFALVDRPRADQHRPAELMLLDEVVDDRLPLVLAGAEDERRQLLANRRAVRRHGNHAALVDLVQLAGAGAGGAGHAGQPVVAQEEVLHGDPGGLVRGERDLDAFLGFDGLVDAGPPLAAFAEPAGELVDDHDLAVADHVLAVEEHLAGHLDRPLDVLVDRGQRHAIHRRRLGQLADQLPAGERQLDRLVFVVVVVVLVLDELRPSLWRPSDTPPPRSVPPRRAAR